MFLNFLCLLLFTHALHAQNAQELLTASDLSRGGIKGSSLTWDTTLESTEDGETNSRTMIVKVKDPDAHVTATAPSRIKGEVYLFNDREMWFFKPGLKKPVPISSRQRLSGQAANGDIASTHYARDYNGTMEKSGTLNGEKVYILLLKAKAPNMTYDQIRYYISDKTKLAVKAEFLNLQGEIFKIGELQYKNSISIKDKTYPFVSELKIIDAKFPQNFSVIRYAKPKLDSHKSSLFNVNNLSR